MDMQHHCMGAADQQRNYVHNYTTSLHPRHPYDAVVYSYEIKWSKLKFNKPIKVQGLKTFKDQKSSGTISFRGNLVRDQNNQNRTKKSIFQSRNIEIILSNLKHAIQEPKSCFNARKQIMKHGTFKPVAAIRIGDPSRTIMH